MWDQVESDFGGDETTNFGPRMESGTALYQIDTLATISPREIVTQSAPHIVASVLGDLACVAVNCHLSVFKDCQFAITLDFGNIIDELAWSPDGIFLVIGDRGGNLTVLDTGSFETIFNSKATSSMEGEQKAFKKIFSHQKTDDLYDLMVLTAGGKLLVIQDITTDLFTAEENISALILEKTIVVDTSEFHTTDTHDVLGCNDKIFTLGSGDSVLTVWKWNSGVFEAEDEVGGIFLSANTALVQGRISSDGKYLITLDSTNDLLLWQTNTLTLMETWSDHKVSEFQFLEMHDVNNNTLHNMKLLMLSKPIDEEKCCLNICNLPRCEIVYSLQLNFPTITAECKPLQETLYIAECCCEDSEHPGTISTVRFRCLTETNPETRLSRLLQKKKFEEAEFFAKTYQLDMELVQKVKSNALLDQLSPWNVHKSSPELQMETLEQLWLSLDLIKDDHHVTDTCMRAALPTLSATQDMLNYCEKRLSQFDSSIKDDNLLKKQQKLLTKLLTIQHRLTTYQMAFGSDAYSGETWCEFIQADLLQEALLWFDKREINIGFQIWSRHQNEWDKNMSPSYVERLLGSIPEHVDPFEILGSICDSVIPYVVRVLPNTLKSVVEWVMQRAGNMEFLQKGKWPSNAIQFLHSVHRCLQDVLIVTQKDSPCTAYDIANKTGLIAKNIVQPLQNMIRNLQHLRDLHCTYKCPMKYDAFLQETTETVAFRMLDKVVAMELINQTLEQQIRPYMRKHNLKEDVIFLRYIKDLLERTGRMTTCIGSTYWEDKVIGIVRCIQNPQRKIEAILEIMKWAAIPWSNEIDGLVKKGLNIEHQSVAELKEQYRLVRIKKLMLKYGLKNMEVPDTSCAQRLMKYIMHYDTTEDCMEDALQVMELYRLKPETGMYFFRSRFLVSKGKIDEYLKLLRSIPSEQASLCGKRMVCYGIVILNGTVEIDTEENHETKRHNTVASVLTCQFLISVLQDHTEVREYREILTILKNLQLLQVEFDIYMTFNQYFISEYRREYFEAYRKEDEKLSKWKIYRLAQIMQIPKTELEGQLAVEAAINRDIPSADRICRDLFESDPTHKTAEVLYQVALLCQRQQADDNICKNKLRDLHNLTLRLVSQTLTICSPEMLTSCLELYKLSFLTQSVIQQCESDDYGLSVESLVTGSAKSTLDWTENCLFQEDGLMMYSGSILPLVSQYTLSHPLFYQAEDDDIDSPQDSSTIFHGKVFPIIQHLKENNHLELSYHFLLHSSSTITQFLGTEVATLHKFQRSLSPSILQKIFICNRVDQILALAYLATMQPKDSKHVLELAYTNVTNNKRLMGISAVGSALGSLFKDSDLIARSNQMEKNSTWAHRLSKAKIMFPLNGNLGERFKVLHHLASSSSIDMVTVKDFCRDFGLDQTEGLRYYVQHIFSSLSSDPTQSPDIRTKQLAKAKAAIREIGYSEELASSLKNIYAETNPYDYETIKMVLEENKCLDPQPYFKKGLKLLDYLKVYKRKAGPSDYEIRYSNRGCSDSETIMLDLLPPDSRTNIPFHPLLDGDPWKIITKELDKDTVESWVAVARLLRLSADQIYLTAVQNIVQNYVAVTKSPDMLSGGASKDKSQWNWDDGDANIQLLTDVRVLLSNVSNYEMALACENWLAQELPVGSEKVLGLKGCIETAKKWYKASKEGTPEEERAEKAFMKFTAVWQRLATEQVLYLHSLAGPEFVRIANKPNALILKLFEHPTVLGSGDLDQHGKPDIYSVAKRICEINSIDLHQMTVSLVEEWLPSMSSKQNDTMTLDLQSMKMADDINPEDEDEKNLKRVLYLLKKGDREKNIRYLWSYIKEEQASTLTSMCQSRALRCLLELDKDHLIKTEFKKSTEDLRYLIRVNSYLVDLEKLNIQHSISTFEKCNKEGLIKGIWRNHRHQKAACMLVASLCLDYGYHDYQLWNSVLQQMFLYKLMNHLEYVLVRLCGIPDMWQVSCFPQVWQAVLTLPLTRVAAPVGEEDIDVCIHHFNLISRCPVLQQLNLQNLSKQYLKLKLPVCALGCLITAQALDRESVESVLCEDKAALLEGVKYMMGHGMDSTIATKVEGLVYDEIVAVEDYSIVIGTKFEKAFIEHIIQCQQVDGLLKFAVLNNRLKQALALFNLYCSHFPDVVSSLIDDASDDGDNTHRNFKAYLEFRGLSEIVEML